MNRHKILLVDDDPSLLKLLSLRLRANGFDIETASSGRQALGKLSASQPHRIHKIVTGLREVIAETHPTILSIEDVFLSKNVKSAFKLGQIRGAVMALAMDQGLEVREFTPSQLKQAVTGYGQADKGQVQYMMKTILGLAEIPKPHDAADALALAISAITHEGWNRKVGSP